MKQIKIGVAKMSKINKLKIPSIYDDVFTEKKLEKKILSKIYVPKDKEFILSLYKKSEEDGLFSLKDDLNLSKADIKRLKTIKKQIKKQKGRIKIIPMFITAGIIMALFSVLIACKDPIIKAVVVNVVESIAGAKCDIENLTVKFFDSRIDVKNIAIANKDEPMTNLVELSDISIDFDLVQLLKGRFVMDLVQAEGIQVGTARLTSGELPQKEKKEKEAVIKETDPLTKEELEQKITQTLKEQTGLDVSKEGITTMLSKINPQTMINGFYDQMQSPKVLKDLEPQTQSIVNSWNVTSKEISTNVNAFTSKAQVLITTDINNIKDINQLRALFDSLTTIKDEANNMKTSMEKATNQLKTDAETIKNIATSVQNAIQNDMNLVNNEITKISNLNFENAVRLFSGELDGPAIDLAKKYIPIAKEILAKVEEFQKSGSKIKKQEKQETKETWRASGRTIEYRKDNIPDVLIRTVKLSGFDAKSNMSLRGTLNNISNDCDKLNKPVDLELVLNRNSVDTEKLNAVLDLRTNRTEKAFTAALSGTGYSVNNLTIPNMQDAIGIPNLSGLLSIDANFGLDTDASFNLDGAVKLASASINIEPFEPAFAHSLYTRAVETINELKLGAKMDFSPEKLMDLNIWTDIDKILSENLSKLFKEEVSNIKNQMELMAKTEIEKISASLAQNFEYFDELKRIVSGDTEIYNEMKEAVDAKIAEIQAIIDAETAKIKGQVESTISNKVNEVLKDIPVVIPPVPAAPTTPAESQETTEGTDEAPTEQNKTQSLIPSEALDKIKKFF